MVFEKLDRIVFRENTPIIDVLNRFNETANYTDSKGFGIVVNTKSKIMGVVSDGDIRRKISKGVSIDSPVSKVMNSDYIYATKTQTPHQILRLFDSHILNIPLVDKDHKILDLFRYSEFRAPSHAVPKIIRARVPVRLSFAPELTFAFKLFTLILVETLDPSFAFMFI